MYKKPRAHVTPTLQVVQWPVQKTAGIDGSSSTGDENVYELKYAWEIRNSPEAYKQEIPQAYKRLKLHKLIPGNYTIRLTVIDSNGKKIAVFTIDQSILCVAWSINWNIKLSVFRKFWFWWCIRNRSRGNRLSLSTIQRGYHWNWKTGNCFAEHDGR